MWGNFSLWRVEVVEVALVGVAEKKKKRKEKRGTRPLPMTPTRLHRVHAQASAICGERGILFADLTIRLP